MAIEYDNNLEIMELLCDNCNYVEMFEGQWYQCIDEAKAFGWTMIKLAVSEWGHNCAQCSGNDIILN